MSKRSWGAHKMETRSSASDSLAPRSIPATYRGERGTHEGGSLSTTGRIAGISRVAPSLSARARQLTPSALGRDMQDLSRRRAAADNRNRSRPRRAALVATLASLAVLGAGVAVANASGGGISASGGGGGISVGSPPTEPVTPGCPNKQLGRRTLKVGDCGGDVATLNWILQRQGLRRGAARRRVRGSDRRLPSRRSRPTPTSVRRHRRRRHIRGARQRDAPAACDLVRPELLRQRDRLRPDADPRDPRRGAQDAALRIEGGAPLQGSLRPHHRDRPRPVRQRRQVGPDPGHRPSAALRVHGRRARREARPRR